MSLLGISRFYLFGLGIFFLYLGANMFIKGPVECLLEHDLKIGGQPLSALAELRAYYTGTLFLCSILFLRGGFHTHRTNDSLFFSFLLLGLFSVVRLYCHLVEGPALLPHAEIIWSLEVLGTAVSLLLYILVPDQSKSIKKA